MLRDDREPAIDLFGKMTAGLNDVVGTHTMRKSSTRSKEVQALLDNCFLLFALLGFGNSEYSPVTFFPFPE